MTQTYRGACHCGRVTFEARADLNYVVDCNCSACGRKGALWHPAADADLRILSGEADLVLYQFHTKTAKHYFCRHCGIHPFIRPRLDPTRWAFNVRCIDGIDAASLKVVPFDGQNWEATARAYHDRHDKKPSSPLRVELDDLSRPQVHALLREHLSNMHELSPPESVHALDLSKLKSPDITFWTVWDGQTLLGCGALKELDPKHGEVKSMRTPKALRRRGAGRAVLVRILEEARARGYARLSLETGAHEDFRAAQRLYESFGFACCGPFPPYVPDPHSVFMTLAL